MYSQQTIEKGKLHECAVSAVCLVSFSPLVLLSTFSLTADFAELQALFGLFCDINSPHKSIELAPHLYVVCFLLYFFLFLFIEWRCRCRSSFFYLPLTLWASCWLNGPLPHAAFMHIHSAVMCIDTAPAAQHTPKFPETIQERLLTISLVSFLIFLFG